MSRLYDSARFVDGPLGIGWSSPLLMRVWYTTYLYSAPSTYYKEAEVPLPSGRYASFRENADGTFSAGTPTFDKLIRNPDGTFDLFPKQSRIRYHFAANGQLESITDSYGNSLLFQYETSGRLQRVSDGSGSGRFLDFFYGADGRVSTVSDSSGRSVSYIYNAQGSLTTSIDATFRQTNYSYTNGRFTPLLTQIRDHWNRVITTITYDAGDRTATYTDRAETYTYTYNYSGDPNKTSKTDSNGRVWVFTHDSQGLVNSQTPPAGQGSANSTTSFTPEGSPILTIDETGVRIAYTYNANGTVSTITRDEQGPIAVRFDYSYDATFPESVISITPKNPTSGLVDPNWQAWRYDYYPLASTTPGALYHVYRVQNDGSTLDTVATYTYNSFGQVLTVTDGSSAITTYSYNATTGDLTSVSYPKNSDAGANPVYQYGRDSAGRVTSVTDPLSKITSYTYDNVDRILTVTLPKPTPGSPLNFVTTYSYDNFDSPTGLVFTNQTDPNSKITKQGYDAFGQMVRSVDALNKTTVFTYTKGLLTSITDANNNVTSYAYNGVHRLTSTIFPNSTTENYTYTLDGLLQTKTDRKNQTINYAYDHLKRLATKTYPNSTTITYSYTGQKLNSVIDNFAAETHSFVYDSSYRVSSNTQGTRGTIGYTYGGADRIATYSVSGGPSATYAYYADGSLKNIQWSPVVGQFSYQYSLNGQYSTISFPNGQTRTYTYDDQGRLLQIANSTSGGTNLAKFQYGYDINNVNGLSTMLGQRTSVITTVPALNISGKTTKYYYDGNYQLNQADYPKPSGNGFNIDSWTYDGIGNRLTNTSGNSTKTYTYYKNGSNPLNGQRLQSDGTNTYTYDNNGSVVSEGNRTYNYDYENRLISISGGVTASYTYDYLGRRKTKTTGGVTTSYLYDGQNLVREITATNAEYVFGPGIDEPLAMTRSGSTYYYDVDGLGSVSVVNNTAGTAQDSYKYDAWGVVLSQTTPVSNPFTYTGREIAEAGLYFYRARYLSSNVGRFVQEDPIRSAKLYSYVRNNPVVYRDPSGLVAWECSYFLGSGGEGPGGGYGSFSCTSHCEGGIRAKAWIKVWWVGVSFGLPFGVTESEITLNDSFSVPMKTSLEGIFTFATVGSWAVGPLGFSVATEVSLGSASGHSWFSGQRGLAATIAEGGLNLFGKAKVNVWIQGPCYCIDPF